MTDKKFGEKSTILRININNRIENKACLLCYKTGKKSTSHNIPESVLRYT